MKVKKDGKGGQKIQEALFEPKKGAKSSLKSYNSTLVELQNQNTVAKIVGLNFEVIHGDE